MYTIPINIDPSLVPWQIDRKEEVEENTENWRVEKIFFGKKRYQNHGSIMCACARKRSHSNVVTQNQIGIRKSLLLLLYADSSPDTPYFGFDQHAVPCRLSLLLNLLFVLLLLLLLFNPFYIKLCVCVRVREREILRIDCA